RALSRPLLAGRHRGGGAREWRGVRAARRTATAIRPARRKRLYTCHRTRPYPDRAVRPRSRRTPRNPERHARGRAARLRPLRLAVIRAILWWLYVILSTLVH